MGKRKLSRMDKLVQEEVTKLSIVYNGKIPIQEIFASMTKKKEDRKFSKDIDLSNLYEKIRMLILEGNLLKETDKTKVYIDRTNSKRREEGMVIIESLNAE